MTTTDNYTADSGNLEKTSLTLGFIPLTDCAPLVVAKEKGYFRKQGLEVKLSKETSWANIRDKVAIGILDGAQMLAPMPLSMTLGLGPIRKPIVTAFSMDLNGNAITVSSGLHKAMQEIDPESMNQRTTSVRALKSVIEGRKKAGKERLIFAVVYPFSSHNYELRYWMASAGINPDHDVRLVVVPPPQMVTQMEQGLIDGYCVGEPWNTLAVQKGFGHTLITKYEIWNNSPEKVLGVSEEWAEQYPNTHKALIKALLEACQWVDKPSNRLEVAALISQSVYVNAPEHIVRMSMTSTYQYALGGMPETMPDFNVFHRYAANYPWRSHAEWFLLQMIRWGHITNPVDIHTVADKVYRPDIFKAAADELGYITPAIDRKPEGLQTTGWQIDGIDLGPDLFFDEQIYLPDYPLEYLSKFEQSNMSTPAEALLKDTLISKQHNKDITTSANKAGTAF